jgi:hypothetical protein
MAVTKSSGTKWFRIWQPSSVTWWGITPWWIKNVTWSQSIEKDRTLFYILIHVWVFTSMNITHTSYSYIHLWKIGPTNIEIYEVTITKGVSLSTRISSITKRIISHKYNAHVKNGALMPQFLWARAHWRSKSHQAEQHMKTLALMCSSCVV